MHDVDATHWLFVDRHGAILEVSNNAGQVVSQRHTQKVYFSRLRDCSAAKALRETAGPIGFELFHGVSRDPSICLKSSVSSLTVEIDPDQPELLTCAWVSLPAHAASFPLLMGQRETPLPLVNGEAYRLCKGTKDRRPLWERIDKTVHASKELLRETVAGERSANKRQAGDSLDLWAKKQSAMILDVLQAVQPTSPGD